MGITECHIRVEGELWGKSTSSMDAGDAATAAREEFRDEFGDREIESCNVWKDNSLWKYKIIA